MTSNFLQLSEISLESVLSRIVHFFGKRIRKVLSWILLWQALYFCSVGSKLIAAPIPNPQWEATYLHFNQKNGLQGQVIYEVFKDSKGFLWIGTDMGLSRYDGYQFTNYSPGDGLTDSDIFGIREDSRGRLWFLTGNGIPGYYQNGKFHNPTTDSWLQKISANGFISAFYEDRKGNIYLGFYDGSAFRIKTDGDLEVLPCKGVCRILGFGESAEFGVYMFTHINKIVYVEKPGFPSSVVSDFVVQGTENYPVKFLKQKKDGVVCSWGKNVRVFDENQVDHYQPEIIGDGKILGIFQGGGASIHVATTKGAYHFEDDNFLRLLEPVAFPERPIYSILEDETSGIWYGTDDGIFLKPKTECRRISGLSGSDRPTTLLTYGDDRLLLGYGNGDIFEFDSKLNLIRSGSVGSLEVRSFHAKSENEIWIRTSGGLFQWIGNKVARIQQFNTRGLDFNLTNPNEMVLCNTNGWFVVDPNAWKEFLFGDERIHFPRMKGEKQCNCVKYANNGDLWISASDGIARYRNGQMTRFGFLGELTNYSTVDQIFITSDRAVFIATVGNGLVIYREGEFGRLTSAQGLESNFVTALAEDPKGGLWVGTTKGVQLLNIPLADGRLLQNSESISMWLKNESVKALAVGLGYVFVATSNDVYAIKKAEIDTNDKIAMPRIEAISVQNGFLPLDSTFELAFDQNSIQFEYVSVSLLEAKTVQYRFRLKGLNEEWIETSDRKANFPALKPASYVFELQSRQIGGEWPKQVVAVNFSVLPPFWQTIWFLFILVIGCIAVISIVLWLIFRNIHRRNELVKRALIAEQKALIIQMNPHFIFNSLNSIQYFYITNDLETANEYLTDFGLLIRAILENGRKQRITLEEEIEVLTLYAKLERLRLRFKFEFSIITDIPEPEKILIPPMILQPFVENSIWHGLSKKEGSNGFLRIEFIVKHNCIEVTIWDNGIGRQKSADAKSAHAARHHSLATAITAERMEILKSSYPGRVAFEIEDLFDHDGNGSGTVVRVTLPLEFVKR